MSLLCKINQIDLKWRLCFVAAIAAVYMVASRIIAGASETFAQVELYRTPLRVVGAVLLWLVMRDVLVRAVRRTETVKDSGFLGVVILVFITPFVAGVYNVPPSDGVILAITSIPVGFFEEILFRGIIQTLCVSRWGVGRGVALSTVLFTLFHVGVTSPDLVNYAQILLMGLILGLVYLKTGSLLAVVIIHAVHDALFSVPVFFYLQDPIFGLVALSAASIYAVCWFSSGATSVSG